ncbi:MAG TPA: Holliday junction resolvase RuvX [Bacteroidales bacterium]|nr:Holliday junction resolvase RuvX [Bacteroidales bacterium]
MGRFLALDIGRKRTGVAITDPLRIIASPLETIPTHKLLDYLSELFQKENIDMLIVGYPRQMNNTPSEAVTYINPLIKSIKKKFPTLPVELVDERFTSKMAMQAMIDGGMKKKDRQDKSNVDKISAALILQNYMEGLKYK